MIKTIKYIFVLLIVAAILVTASIIKPCNIFKCNNTIVHTDTVYLYDTVTHYIITPPIVIKDTIIYTDTIPANIDTLAILKEYYAYHYYTRNWSDENIEIALKDVLTQNNFFDSNLSYKILRPQTIINNTYTTNVYSKGLYAGISTNPFSLKHSSIDLLYLNNRFMYGIGYMPYYNGIQFKAYINIKK